jgi:hypothetical protein
MAKKRTEIDLKFLVYEENSKEDYREYKEGN